MSANPKLLPTPPSTPFTLAARSLLSTNVSLFKAQSVETLKTAQPGDSEQCFHCRAEMQRNWRLFQVASPQGWAFIKQPLQDWKCILISHLTPGPHLLQQLLPLPEDGTPPPQTVQTVRLNEASLSLQYGSVVRREVCRAWWSTGGALLSSLGGNLTVVLC